MAFGQDRPVMATQAVIRAYAERVLTAALSRPTTPADYASVRRPLSRNEMRAIEQAGAAMRVMRELERRDDELEALVGPAPVGAEWIGGLGARAQKAVTDGVDELIESLQRGFWRVARVIWSTIRRELFRLASVLQRIRRTRRIPTRPAWARWSTTDEAVTQLVLEVRRRLGLPSSGLGQVPGASQAVASLRGSVRMVQDDAQAQAEAVEAEADAARAEGVSVPSTQRSSDRTGVYIALGLVGAAAVGGVILASAMEPRY